MTHKRQERILSPHADELVFEDDLVLLDGTPLRPHAAAHFYAVLNKPTGTLCATRDPRGGRDLNEWLSQMPAGTFAVGRLDRDTTGLILLTTDGDLANGVLRPERHLDKTYWLWLEEPELTTQQLHALTDTKQVVYDPAKQATLLRRTSDYVEVELTLDQGKHRQIRRMCRALGLRLLHLHRRSVGPLEAKELSVGNCRPLTTCEVHSLWQAIGGKQRLAEEKLTQLIQLAKRRQAAGTPHTRLERWLSHHAPSAGDQIAGRQPAENVP